MIFIGKSVVKMNKKTSVVRSLREHDGVARPEGLSRGLRNRAPSMRSEYCQLNVWISGFATGDTANRAALKKNE